MVTKLRVYDFFDPFRADQMRSDEVDQAVISTDRTLREVLHFFAQSNTVKSFFPSGFGVVNLASERSLRAVAAADVVSLEEEDIWVDVALDGDWMNLRS